MSSPLMTPRLVLLVGLISMVALAACNAAPERPTRADSGSGRTQADTSMGWTVTLAPPGEPGEPLLMQGRVLDHKHVPAGGVEIEVYHADAAGLYAKGPNERPRLAGRLRTSADGRYEIHTVMPGGNEGPPHIHVTLRPRWGGPQYFTVNVPSPLPPRRAPRQTKSHRIDWLAPPMMDFVRDSSGVLRLQHDFLVTR